ncbi:hypothetical protein B0H17DRAFT_1133768 [Mycena rosella]|uniref:Uncharacterized protein n=1 Tax=Mycena rosella TaxID=1033263 RepID=A0AAD7DI68_MYCRO|nr:hypothetical protein B0H17DRAFT_1133768 [Mycena rosella]
MSREEWTEGRRQAASSSNEFTGIKYEFTPWRSMGNFYNTPLKTVKMFKSVQIFTQLIQMLKTWFLKRYHLQKIILTHFEFSGSSTNCRDESTSHFQAAKVNMLSDFTIPTVAKHGNTWIHQLTIFRYVKKVLAGFRVGDIVEMGFGSVAFRQASRNEDDKQIWKLILRTLTLLDNSFAKVTFKAHSKNGAKAPSVGSRPMQVI